MFWIISLHYKNTNTMKNDRIQRVLTSMMVQKFKEIKKENLPLTKKRENITVFSSV